MNVSVGVGVGGGGPQPTGINTMRDQRQLSYLTLVSIQVLVSTYSTIKNALKH